MFPGAQQLIDAALNGINVTIMAYGATSSGKTYTMSGLEQSSGGRDAASGDKSVHEGLIVMTARDIFSKLLVRAFAMRERPSLCGEIGISGLG